MLMSGKMSTGVRRIVIGVRMMMSSAITTNVYGRRRANATIHIGLAKTCNAETETGLWDGGALPRRDRATAPSPHETKPRPYTGWGYCKTDSKQYVSDLNYIRL